MDPIPFAHANFEGWEQAYRDRLLRLPFSNSLDIVDLGRVVSTVQDFRV